MNDEMPFDPFYDPERRFSEKLRDEILHEVIGLPKRKAVERIPDGGTELGPGSGT